MKNLFSNIKGDAFGGIAELLQHRDGFGLGMTGSDSASRFDSARHGRARVAARRACRASRTTGRIPADTVLPSAQAGDLSDMSIWSIAAMIMPRVTPWRSMGPGSPAA